jgi:uncharacterized membrane protein YecN with MAPEG domain
MTVVSTEKICHQITQGIVLLIEWKKKIPFDMNSIFMNLYVTWPTYISEIWIFEVIFVVFRLMKNIILNKTESFVGRNTSDRVKYFALIVTVKLCIIDFSSSI